MSIGRGRLLRSLVLGTVFLGASVMLAANASERSAARPRSDHDLGSRWPFDHTFASQPPRAQPVPGSACEVANEYVTRGGSETPAMFAPDGVYMGPYDIIYRGPAEIALWYTRPGAHEPGKAGEGPPKIIPLSFVDRGDECFMELANLRPSIEPGKPAQYRLVAVDHFTVGPDRKIKRLVIYIRPDPLEESIRRGDAHGRAAWPIPPSTRSQ